jgi:hypothetical protein
MSSSTVSTTLYVEPEGPECEGHELGELEVEVEGVVNPYVPARLSGHPDTWCPEEGGDVEITSAKVEGRDWTLSKDEEAQARDQLAEAAADAWWARRAAYAEAAAEARWESRYV